MCGKAYAAAQAGLEAEERAQAQAEFMTLQHRDAKARGREGEAAIRRDVRTMQGSQRAGYAGQGVDVESGSAVAVQADTAQVGEMDALQIRSDATRESWAIRQQRKFVKYQGRVARRTGFQSMYSSIVGGVASAVTRVGAGGGFGGPAGPVGGGGASGLGGGSPVPTFYKGSGPGATYSSAP